MLYFVKFTKLLKKFYIFVLRRVILKYILVRRWGRAARVQLYLAVARLRLPLEGKLSAKPTDEV